MYSQLFVSIVLGSVLGFIFSALGPNRNKACHGIHDTKQTNLGLSETHGSKLLFVGVLSAAKYLDTRTMAVNQTWASDMPGRVEFFISYDKSKTIGDLNNQMPVKILHGVMDNEYPPKQKVMAMLRYMYEKYANDYEWFMRADDDVYVRTDKLQNFLRRLDGSKEVVVVGQGGVGKIDEVNKLGLKPHECYCLGGPGVIISRNVLTKIVPNIESCLNEGVSDHEDVELGRCVRKYAGISCMWAQEAKVLFQQVYRNQEDAYHGVLNKGINKALTLHPVKDPAYMFRLHYHFMTIKLYELRCRSYKKNGILEQTKRIVSGALNFTSFATRSRNTDFYLRANASSNLVWAYFAQKNLWAPIKYFDLKNQVSYLMLRFAEGIKKATALIMEELNGKYRKTLGENYKLNRLTLSNIDYGYWKENPKYGVEYHLCLSIKLPNKIAPSFAWRPIESVNTCVQAQHGFSPLQGRIQPDIERIMVHFIVPLQGKYEELRRFLASVKEEFLTHGERIAVLVVYFPESSSPKKHIKQINELKLEFPETMFAWLNIPGEFNRAKALQKGAAYLGNNSLLFFSDVDLVFQKEFVNRCRDNTIKSKQVYMPVMFGQYNPDIAYFKKVRPKTNFVYKKPDGRWRIFSYGPVCIYGADVMAVGGLNTNIKGWGKEDTDFASRIVKHGLTIQRAPDQGIVHVFHEHVPCDKRLSHDQRQQCKRATLSTYAPKTEAVDYLISKMYIE